MKKMETTNTFDGGLLMDFNPLVTPNNVLTNALNATFLTYNGNEYVLLNDFGNGRVETARLPQGYVPLGTKEFGGIIYIVSYNPLENKCQVGSFPSPERNIDSFSNNSIQLNILFSDFVSDECIYNDVKKILLTDKIIYPGDKFVIKPIQDVALDLVETITTKREPTPMYIDILIDDESILNNGDEKESFIVDKNNNEIFNSKFNELNKKDIDTYRKTISKLFVNSSKKSGKLYLLALLNIIKNFNIRKFFSLNEKGDVILDFIFEFDKYNRDFKIKSEISENLYIESILDINISKNNNLHTLSIKIEKTKLEEGIKNNYNKNFNITFTPVHDDIGKQCSDAISINIDIDLLIEKIELTEYRYFVNEENNITFNYGFNVLENKNNPIEEMNLLFISKNNLDVNSLLLDIIGKKYIGNNFNNNFEFSFNLNDEEFYRMNDSENENSIPKNIQFNKNLKYKLDVSRIHKVVFDFKYKNGTRKQFIRWMFPDGVFNKKYNDTIDFNILKLDLDFNIELLNKKLLSKTEKYIHDKLTSDENEDGSNYFIGSTLLSLNGKTASLPFNITSNSKILDVFESTINSNNIKIVKQSLLYLGSNMEEDDPAKEFYNYLILIEGKLNEKIKFDNFLKYKNSILTQKNSIFRDNASINSATINDKTIDLRLSGFIYKNIIAKKQLNTITYKNELSPIAYDKYTLLQKGLTLYSVTKKYINPVGYNVHKKLKIINGDNTQKDLKVAEILDFAITDKYERTTDFSYLSTINEEPLIIISGLEIEKLKNVSNKFLSESSFEFYKIKDDDTFILYKYNEDSVYNILINKSFDQSVYIDDMNKFINDDTNRMGLKFYINIDQFGIYSAGSDNYGADGVKFFGVADVRRGKNNMGLMNPIKTKTQNVTISPDEVDMKNYGLIHNVSYLLYNMIPKTYDGEDMDIPKFFESKFNLSPEFYYASKKNDSYKYRAEIPVNDELYQFNQQTRGEYIAKSDPVLSYNTNLLTSISVYDSSINRYIPFNIFIVIDQNLKLLYNYDIPPKFEYAGDILFSLYNQLYTYKENINFTEKKYIPEEIYYSKYKVLLNSILELSINPVIKYYNESLEGYKNSLDTIYQEREYDKINNLNYILNNNTKYLNLDLDITPSNYLYDLFKKSSEKLFETRIINLSKDNEFVSITYNTGIYKKNLLYIYEHESDEFIKCEGKKLYYPKYNENGMIHIQDGLYRMYRSRKPNYIQNRFNLLNFLKTEDNLLFVKNIKDDSFSLYGREASGDGVGTVDVHYSNIRRIGLYDEYLVR